MNGWPSGGGDHTLMPTIGVLALQGAFREHCQRLRSIGVATREVRLPVHLDGLDGLVIPGGESTTIARLLQRFGLQDPLREQAKAGFPIWGTCAGAILLGDAVPGLDRPPLGLLPIAVERNAYGRQVDSFETDLDVPALGAKPFHAVFIRAPRIAGLGTGVEVLARHEDDPVIVRRGPLLATTFHPELTSDVRLHGYFMAECVGAAESAAGLLPTLAGGSH